MKRLFSSALFVTLFLSFYATGEGVAVARGRGDLRPSHAVPETHQAVKHFNRGVRYSLRKDYDKAIEEYKQSLLYNNRVAIVHSNLGFVYLDKGEYDLAIESQKRALAIDPSSINAFYGIAMAYEKKGSKENAIKSWEQFLEVADPHTPWWKKARERLKRLKAEKDT
ncbi:MAG: tetratricopeptide repeat protein [Thermodesulfobacteriota bacterium]